VSFAERGGFLRGLDRWLEREESEDGFYGRRVERTCCDCGEKFLVPVVGEYQVQVQCPRCEQRSRVSAEEIWERH
jgi:uncharacterized paraquat-inducible protein A